MDRTYSFQSPNWGYLPGFQAAHAYQKFRYGDYKTTNVALQIIHKFTLIRWTYYLFVATPIVGTVATLLVKDIANAAFLFLYFTFLPAHLKKMCQKVDLYSMWKEAYLDGANSAGFIHTFQACAEEAPDRFQTISWESAKFLSQIPKERRAVLLAEGNEELWTLYRSQEDIRDLLPEGASLSTKARAVDTVRKREILEFAEVATLCREKTPDFVDWLSGVNLNQLSPLCGAYLQPDELEELFQVKPFAVPILAQLYFLKRERWKEFIALYREHPHCAKRGLVERAVREVGEDFSLHLLAIQTGVETELDLKQLQENFDEEALYALGDLEENELVPLLKEAFAAPPKLRSVYALFAIRDRKGAQELLEAVGHLESPTLYRGLSEVYDQQKRSQLTALITYFPLLSEEILASLIPLLALEAWSEETVRALWPNFGAIENPDRLPWILKAGEPQSEETIEKVRLLSESEYSTFLSLVGLLSVEEALSLPLGDFDPLLRREIQEMKREKILPFIRLLPPLRNRPLLLRLFVQLHNKGKSSRELFMDLLSVPELEANTLLSLLPHLEENSLERVKELRGNIHWALEEYGKIEKNFDRILEFAEHVPKELTKGLKECISGMHGLEPDELSPFVDAYQKIHDKYRSRFLHSFKGLSPKDKGQWIGSDMPRHLTRYGFIPNSTDLEGIDALIPEGLRAEFGPILEEWRYPFVNWISNQFLRKFASTFLQNREIVPDTETLRNILQTFWDRWIDPWSPAGDAFAKLAARIPKDKIGPCAKALAEIALKSSTCATVFGLLSENDRLFLLEDPELEKICACWGKKHSTSLTAELTALKENERLGVFLSIPLNESLIDWAFSQPNPLLFCSLSHLRDSVESCLPYFPLEFFEHLSREGLPKSLFEVLLPAKLWEHKREEVAASFAGSWASQFVLHVWDEGNAYLGGFIPPLRKLSLDLSHVKKKSKLLQLEDNLPHSPKSLLKMFDQIHGKCELIIEDDEKKREVRKGLKRLISHVKKKTPASGTPNASDPKALARFYKRLETLLKNGMKLLEEIDDPEVTMDYLYAMGEAGANCGSRWMGEASNLLARLLRRRSREEISLEDELFYLLGCLRLDAFDAALKNADAHHLGAMAQKLGTRYQIPGHIDAEESLYSGKDADAVEKRWLERYTLFTILTALEKHLATTDSPALNMETFTQKMVEWKPEGWQPSGSLAEIPADFRTKAIELIEALNKAEDEKSRKEARINVLSHFAEQNEKAVFSVDAIPTHFRPKTGEEAYKEEVLLEGGRIRRRALAYLLLKMEVVKLV